MSLKYAHENGCPWDEDTCSEAAKGGHLKVLKYAHENGCPWDEWTCSGAAGGGHLEVLKYAHETHEKVAENGKRQRKLSSLNHRQQPSRFGKPNRPTPRKWRGRPGRNRTSSHGYAVFDRPVPARRTTHPRDTPAFDSAPPTRDRHGRRREEVVQGQDPPLVRFCGRDGASRALDRSRAASSPASLFPRFSRSRRPSRGRASRRSRRGDRRDPHLPRA